MEFDRVLDGALREEEKEGVRLEIVSSSSYRRRDMDTGETLVIPFARKVWPELDVSYVALLSRRGNSMNPASPEGVSWFPLDSPEHRFIERELDARRSRIRTDPPAGDASGVSSERKRELSSQIAQADLVAVVRLFPSGGHISTSIRPEGVAYGFIDWLECRAFGMSVERVLRGEPAPPPSGDRLQLWICDTVARRFEGEEQEFDRWTRASWPVADGSPILVLLRREQKSDGSVFHLASQKGISWFPLGSPEHAYIAEELRRGP